VTVDGDSLVVDGRRIRVIAERDPANLPWKDLGVEIVLESTGRFTSNGATRAHLYGGASKVLVSAPADGADVTLAFGVNSSAYDPAVHNIISNASRTTNALAPLASVLDDLGDSLIASSIPSSCSPATDRLWLAVSGARICSTSAGSVHLNEGADERPTRGVAVLVHLAHGCSRQRAARKPPSTGRVIPWMWVALSLARNTMAEATTSAVPARPSGWPAASCSRNSW
jgi:hypothetical protein